MTSTEWPRARAWLDVQDGAVGQRATGALLATNHVVDLLHRLADTMPCEEPGLVCFRAGLRTVRQIGISLEGKIRSMGAIADDEANALEARQQALGACDALRGYQPVLVGIPQLGACNLLPRAKWTEVCHEFAQDLLNGAFDTFGGDATMEIPDDLSGETL